MEMRVIFITLAPFRRPPTATTDAPSPRGLLPSAFPRNFAEYVEILEAISREITHAGTFHRSTTLPREITSLLGDNKFLS